MSKQISKIYHAAIYVRLSKEDGDVSTNAKAESNSISNQKDFIRNFLADKKDIRIVKEYVDDGYSGSNFDRPSFQTMMEDIKRGVIDCVVVKDLSRFGREYIDSGRYIERLFPALGVRFIAINDNYDSVTGKSQGDEIIIPFKNLINDAYCRDISIKIRSHLDVKRKNGEYIGAFVPYGYEKSEDDKHKLVIDTYAAGIVKEIFRLKLHGMSQDAIATQLNNEGVLAPMEYKQSTGSGYQTGFLQNEKSVWSSVTVRRILENEIYIGNLVQGKRTTPNHKVKQEVVKPESDWIRIEKNHEPIISDRDFEIVQRLLGMDTRISPDSDVVYNLSGIAVCADCGSPMTRKITTAGDKKYAYYICSNHKLTKQCSQHSISVSLLEDTVLEMLKLHIKNVMNLEEILDYVLDITVTELLQGEKLKENKTLNSDVVETLVVNSLDLSLCDTIRQRKKNWIFAFLISIGVVVIEAILLTVSGISIEQMGDSLYISLLMLLFASWLCIFAKELLPTYYDTNKVNFVSQGIFRIHMAGLCL